MINKSTEALEDENSKVTAGKDRTDCFSHEQGPPPPPGASCTREQIETNRADMARWHAIAQAYHKLIRANNNFISGFDALDAPSMRLARL